MHPRNPYKIPPDFASLAQAYPPLQQFLINASTGRTIIDFKNERAQRCLTQAIMFCDFGIQLHIPEDRLCPPVPNRMNYVLWIQDIVNTTQAFRTRVRATRGIDIGTGATAIYPILACKLKEDWEMIGTELDDMSYGCAQRNVETNNLNGRIILKRARKDDAIFFPFEDDSTNYDFTMCNPPFYSSAQEMNDLSKAKTGVPNAVSLCPVLEFLKTGVCSSHPKVCTGSDIEMIYPDRGEVGFVGGMVEESTIFQGRCTWYTSMLGRMSSVIEIVQLFRKRNISNYAITEFVQGRTRRWAVGWSFSETRLPDSISRIPLHQSHALAHYLPLRTTLLQPLRISSAKTHKDLARCLIGVLTAIEGIRVTEHNDDHQHSSLRIEAQENTWSRSARRKRKMRRLDSGEKGNEDICRDAQQSPSPKLVCDVRIILPRHLDEGTTSNRYVYGKGETDVMGAEWVKFEMGEDVEENEVVEASKPLNDVHYSFECQWVVGRDYGFFESFAGHVGRKLIEYIQLDVTV